MGRGRPKGLEGQRKDQTQRHQERAKRLLDAVNLLGGLRKGICPCGYMGTMQNGTCFKCGTKWDIRPAPRESWAAGLLRELFYARCNPMGQKVEELIAEYDFPLWEKIHNALQVHGDAWGKELGL